MTCGLTCLKNYCISIGTLLLLVSLTGLGFCLYLLFADPVSELTQHTSTGPNWENLGMLKVFKNLEINDMVQIMKFSSTFYLLGLFIFFTLRKTKFFLYFYTSPIQWNVMFYFSFY